jgi:hypothetical protein
MKRSLWLFSIIVLVIVVALASPGATAQTSNVVSPNSVAYGRTFSEWSAAWEQWAYSIPVDQHPLFDNGDCSVGQSGPVWFLGGKFCANGTNCSYTGVVRSCRVPSGKALYFPVLNGEDSALEESTAEHPGDESWQQINAMRSMEDGGMSPANVFCSIDAVPIPRLKDNFRVQSTAFGFTIPTDNYLNSVYGLQDFLPGTYFPAIDDGWYVMLSPLPPGSHVLRIRGSNGGFNLEVTYNLNITK